METKGIRMEIKPWLYKILVKQQEKFRHKTGRKTSLADILLDYCLKGLKMYKTEKNLSQNVLNEVGSGLNGQQKPQKMVNSVQNNGETVQNSVQNDLQNVQNRFLEDQLKLLEYKEKQLNNREKRLIAREKMLATRESVQNRKNVQYFVQKEQLLEQREKDLEKYADNVLNKHSLGQLNNNIEVKDQLIQKLENIISKQDDKINQLLSSVNNLKENSKKVSTIERIMPFITPVLSIAGYFLLNKKIKNVKELEPVQKQIEGLLKSLNDDDRKLLMGLLKNNDINGK